MALVSFVLSDLDRDAGVYAGRTISLRADWVVAVTPYVDDVPVSVVTFDRPVCLFEFNFREKDSFKVIGTPAEIEQRVNHAMRLAI